MMLKPPICRMGGKSKLRKRIIELIPEHVCYIEPFFGAGWVYFGKEASKVEVINDTEKELMNLFRMIKYHSEEIDRLIRYEVSGRDMFNEYKDANIDKLTEIQRAVRYLYIISQSFGGKGTVYGYGTTTRPSPQIYCINNLKMLKERLRNTYIENIDFSKVIDKYDRQYSFFFCDPPYYETDGYATKFGEEEHIILRNRLSNIKGKFILTINDHPKVREWYRGFNMDEVEVRYSVSKDQSGRRLYKELIIKNY